MKVYERILMESCNVVPYNVMDDNSLAYIAIENSILSFSNSMNELFFNALNEITTESSNDITLEGFFSDIFKEMKRHAEKFWKNIVTAYEYLMNLFKKNKKEEEEENSAIDIALSKAEIGTRLIKNMQGYGPLLFTKKPITQQGIFRTFDIVTGIRNIMTSQNYEMYIDDSKMDEVIRQMMVDLIQFNPHIKDERSFTEFLQVYTTGKIIYREITSELLDVIRQFNTMDKSCDYKASYDQAKQTFTSLIDGIKFTENELNKKGFMSGDAVRSNIYLSSDNDDLDIRTGGKDKFDTATRKQACLKYLKMCINVYTKTMNCELAYLKKVGNALKHLENDINTIFIPSVMNIEEPEQ